MPERKIADEADEAFLRTSVQWLVLK